MAYDRTMQGAIKQQPARKKCVRGDNPAVSLPQGPRKTCMTRHFSSNPPFLKQPVYRTISTTSAVNRRNRFFFLLLPVFARLVRRAPLTVNSFEISTSTSTRLLDFRLQRGEGREKEKCPLRHRIRLLLGEGDAVFGVETALHEYPRALDATSRTTAPSNY